MSGGEEEDQHGNFPPSFHRCSRFLAEWGKKKKKKLGFQRKLNYSSFQFIFRARPTALYLNHIEEKTGNLVSNTTPPSLVHLPPLRPSTPLVARTSRQGRRSKSGSEKPTRNCAQVARKTVFCDKRGQ